MLWQRLYDELAGQVRRGELPAGTKLPSIQELCRTHRVSHMTVRSALARLMAEGLVTSRPGAGCFSAGTAARSRATAAGLPQVALVLPSADAFFVDIIRGAEAWLHDHGHRLVMAVVGHDGAVLAERMCGLLDSVRGFIVCAGRGGHDYRAWVPLLERRTPFVFLDQWIPGLAAPLVATDNQAGGYLATQHLIDLGHRRIWIMAERGFSSMDERLAGYRNALSDASIAADPALVLTSDLVGTPAADALAQQIAAQLKPGDAIFACNEPLAKGAYLAIRQRGWRPGRDVAVVGFDDTYAEHFEPPLTTVAQDMTGMGATAAQVLLRRIGETTATPVTTIRLAPRLVLRASSTSVQEVA